MKKGPYWTGVKRKGNYIFAAWLMASPMALLSITTSLSRDAMSLLVIKDHDVKFVCDLHYDCLQWLIVTPTLYLDQCMCMYVSVNRDMLKCKTDNIINRLYPAWVYLVPVSSPLLIL